MYVLTFMNFEEKDEFVTSVIAVSDSQEKLQAHAVAVQNLAEDEAHESFTWVEAGPEGREAEYLMAAVSDYERYEIEPIEVV